MSSISAGTTTTTGYVVSSDTTGALVLKTGASGTTALTIDTSQNVTFVGSQTLSGGTANGVAYLNGSKVVTSGSALTFDGTNMGLGAASPASLGSSIPTLELKGAITSRTGGLRLRSSDNSVDGYFYADSAGFFIGSGSATDVRFGYGGSEQMRLTSTGLGIGTSSPAAKLDVYNPTATGTNVIARFRFNNASTGGAITLANQAGTDLNQISNVGDASGTALVFSNYNSGTALTEFMRLSGSGNLGLGVTPSAWQSGARAQQMGATYSLALSAFGDDSSITTNAFYNTSSNWVYQNTASSYKPTRYNQYLGNHIWSVAASTGTAGSTITWSESARIDSSGRFGIGTTSPYSKLDLGSYGSNSQLSWHQDSTTSYGTLAIQNSSAAIGLLSGLKMGSSSNSFASSISSTWAKSAILLDYGNIKFFTDPADTVSYGTTYTPTERARINSAGDLGIGTASPGARLEIYQSAGGTNAIRMNTNFGSGNYVDFNPSVAGVSNNGFSISLNGVIRQVIDGSGNLLVGTTSQLSGGSYGSHQIQASQGGGGAGALVVYNNSGVDSSDSIVAIKSSATTTSSQRFIQFYANAGATAMGGIVGNGASNVQFAALSDAREKTNVQPISGSLEKIFALKPVAFDWIQSGEHVKSGFIAQDVEQVFPEFVVENMSGEGEESRKGLTGGMTSGIIPHLVKAIQEQQALIESLTQRIAALEGTS